MNAVEHGQDPDRHATGTRHKHDTYLYNLIGRPPFFCPTGSGNGGEENFERKGKRVDGVLG